MTPAPAACVGDPEHRRSSVCSPGTPLHATPQGANGWTWLDDQDRPHIDAAPELLREDASAFWSWLAETDIAEYSALRAATNLAPGYWWHVHRPDTHAPRDLLDRPAPECCGQSMRLAPAAWVCRVSEARFPFTTHAECPGWMPEVADPGIRYDCEAGWAHLGDCRSGARTWRGIGQGAWQTN
jgi:hypothetical protein